MFGIFGFGDGKMELQLTNVNVAPGDTLEGTASLTMKKDVMGKEVVAILSGENGDRTNHSQGCSLHETTSNIFKVADIGHRETLHYCE